MICKTMAALILSAAANLLAVGMASAQDFNITVPIRLSSFPREVTQGEVWCWAGLADMPLIHIGGFGPDRSGKVVGRGRTAFPMDGNAGGFTGNVAVRFSADPGKNPGDAAIYWCVLRLERSPGQFEQIGEGAPPAKPGTPLTTSVTGSLLPPPAQSPVRQAPAPAREILKK